MDCSSGDSTIISVGGGVQHVSTHGLKAVLQRHRLPDSYLPLWQAATLFFCWQIRDGRILFTVYSIKNSQHLVHINFFFLFPNTYWTLTKVTFHPPGKCNLQHIYVAMTWQWSCWVTAQRYIFSRTYSSNRWHIKHSLVVCAFNHKLKA